MKIPDSEVKYFHVKYLLDPETGYTYKKMIRFALYNGVYGIYISN